MNNQLQVPYKTTAAIPSLSSNLKTFITNNFKNSISSEAFTNDILVFVQLRKLAVENGIEPHKESIARLIRYHANVAYLLTKLPADIHQPFPYSLPFAPPYTLHTPPLTPLPTLLHERFAILFNLAACYANIGALDDRSESNGLKRATAAFQNAAGVFSLLQTQIIPALDALSTTSSVTATSYDLKAGFIECLRYLVEAQAQECFWQKAVLEKYKNGIIAKLSMRVSELYDLSLLAMAQDSPPASGYIPSNWTLHMNVKKFHFAGAAQYRMSIEDLEKGRYGHEIGRLQVAQSQVKKALESAKKGAVSDAVLNDLKGLSSTLNNALARAQRDNDLIYLAAVPPPSELPSIQGAQMVKPVIPPEVENSLEWLMKEGGGLGWEGLVDYGVHLAISVYEDRKDTLVREEIVLRKEELDSISSSILQSMNLPGSLQATERPIGLPPSLLNMAENVRSSGGGEKVKRLMEDVAIARNQARGLLDESLDILDQEAAEDESFQVTHRSGPSRPPSHELNRDLIAQANAYRNTLDQAKQSDGLVAEKWEQWEDSIDLLGGPEYKLVDSVPQLPSAASISNPGTRQLHTLLDELNQISANRERIVEAAKLMAASDDVRPIVLQEAAAVQRGAGVTGVKPEWFESSFEKQLKKYDDLRRDMEATATEEEALVEKIRLQNEEFVSSRKTSPEIKSREQALQALDVTFHKYRELLHNLSEGLKFYGDFGMLLSRFKDSCNEFVWRRRSDIGLITASMATANIPQSAPPQPQQLPSQSTPAPQLSTSSLFPPSPVPAVAPTFFLPHPGSASWQSSPVRGPQLPPPPSPAKPKRKGGGGVV